MAAKKTTKTGKNAKTALPRAAKPQAAKRTSKPAKTNGEAKTKRVSALDAAVRPETIPPVPPLPPPAAARPCARSSTRTGCFRRTR